jgi:hypothetical protein
MSTSNIPNEYRFFVAIFLASLVLIFLLDGGLATAGVNKYVTVNVPGF